MKNEKHGWVFGMLGLMAACLLASSGTWFAVKTN